MAGVEIATLRLRGPPHLASRAAFRIEDGLRTELADTHRLVLVRRMRTETRAASNRMEDRFGAIGSAYQKATLGARHGRDAGDGAAVNCVWFESPAEARRLFLAELLAGHRPDGWFWRLAVPEWRALGLEGCLSEIAKGVLEGNCPREFPDLFIYALEKADLALVLRALAVAASAPKFAGRSPPPSSPGLVSPAVAARPEREAEAERDEPRRSLLALRARLPAPLCDRIETLARRIGPSERALLRLFEHLLLRASPSLALAPERLRQLSRAWAGRLSSPETAGAAPDMPRPAGAESVVGPRSAPVVPDMSGPVVETARSAAAAAAESPLDEAIRNRPIAASGLEAPFASVPGPMSDRAGLWLVVPPLIRLGFREWLAGRPDLLQRDPGRTLLRTIARHHRLEGDDPALAAFAALDPLGDTPGWARRWRKGLDSWLRRRAGMSLHRLMRKRGEVNLAEDSLVVCFPLEAADIRLRRLALDVDPGWVDWLGLSIRYRYEGKAR